MSEQFETIVVATFEDEHNARQAMAELTHAGNKQVFKLKDITHIQVDPDGNVRVQEGVEQNAPRRGLIGSALNFSLKVAKTGTITLAKTGAWLTLVGTSMLAERLAQRLQAAGIGENRLIEKAGAIPRGGLTVVTVMGQNSAGAVSQLITRAGGVVRPTADGNAAEPTAEAHIVAVVEPPEPFPLTHDENRYLRKALEKVSRSFALVIPNLEAPFSNYMATAYLICRVVDNIEDCTQLPAWKAQRFEEFHELLNQPDDAHITLAQWSQAEWPGLTADEVNMMGVQEGGQLWAIYAKIPAHARASIRRWVGEMAIGMTRFEGPEQAELFTEYGEVRVLTDASGYNAYCFYVAGTVGHLASELAVTQYVLADEVAKRLDLTAEACGRALQKTNILKDFAEDLVRGVSYLPDTWHRKIDHAALELAGAPKEWTRYVINNITTELQTASAYVLALPYHAQGYRMACLMSLLPAYQTLLLAAENHAQLFTPDHRVKISRPAMAKCQQDAKSMLADNEMIQTYCEEIERRIEVALA